MCRAGCPGLSWMVLAQFTQSLLKCVLQPKIAKNSLITPILGVHGRSVSSMLVPLQSSSAVLVMISSKSVSICNRFHARWANSGKITISKGGCPSLMPSFEGNLLTQRHQDYLVRNYRDSGLSHSEDFMILSCVVLTQYSSVTDGRTDRQTDGRAEGRRCRSKDAQALHAVARKSLELLTILYCQLPPLPYCSFMIRHIK